MSPDDSGGDADGDLMVAYDDGSKEYGPTFLEQWADLAVREPASIGVERQRANHFPRLLGVRFRFSLPDGFGRAAFDPLAHPGGAAHQRVRRRSRLPLQHRRARSAREQHDRRRSRSGRHLAPSRAGHQLHVEPRTRPQSYRRAADDARCIGTGTGRFRPLLGNRFAVSRVSYVDHLGIGGMHHPPEEGMDGGDRALNPCARFDRTPRQKQ
jgi:hypothetical protein